jgi:hypothetical protein
MSIDCDTVLVIHCSTSWGVMATPCHQVCPRSMPERKAPRYWAPFSSTISSHNTLTHTHVLTFLLLCPGACFALIAKRSLICCSSARFSSRTLPRSDIARPTSDPRIFLNSSTCTDVRIVDDVNLQFTLTVVACCIASTNRIRSPRISAVRSGVSGIKGVTYQLRPPEAGPRCLVAAALILPGRARRLRSVRSNQIRTALLTSHPFSLFPHHG